MPSLGEAVLLQAAAGLVGQGHFHNAQGDCCLLVIQAKVLFVFQAKLLH